MIYIQKVSVLPDFTLSLTLTNGLRIERQMKNWTLGLKNYLEPIADEKFFRRVKVKEGAVEWPGERDVSPGWLIYGTCLGGRGRPPKKAMFTKRGSMRRV